MKIQGTPLLEALIDSTGRYRILEGGARSSKTWSIIQFIILYLQANPGSDVTISRARLTWLRATVYKDFITVLKRLGYYREEHHNKTELKYNFWGSDISFIGLDEPQKLHGRAQVITWVNEAVEATKDDVEQLDIRTEELIIFDYNPSFEDHFIYNYEGRDRVDFLRSTVLDNPFAPEGVRDKILSYDPGNPYNVEQGTADPDLWNIYGLGKRAKIEGLVFPGIKWVEREAYDKLLEGAYKWKAYGLDFGYSNDYTALMEIVYFGGCLYIREVIYETGLTPRLLADRMAEAGVSKGVRIVADSARPDTIAELKQDYGYQIVKSVKGPGSVEAGIGTVKGYDCIYVTADSIGFKEETQKYKYKKDVRADRILNVPIDAFNHGWDAIRYAVVDKVGYASGLVAKGYGR